MLPEELQTAGPLGSTGITPLRSYFGPVRRPLAFSRFPGVTGYTAYLAPSISRRDEEGLSSCLARPCHHAVDNHPAGVPHRISLFALGHAAFAKSVPARPPRQKVSRPPLVRLRYGLVTRSHPFDGLVGRLQNPGFPIAILLPKLQGSDYYPGGTISHRTRQPSLDARRPHPVIDAGRRASRVNVATVPLEYNSIAGMAKVGLTGQNPPRL